MIMTIEEINNKIKELSRKQDQWMTIHGDPNEDIENQIEDLIDLMEE